VRLLIFFFVMLTALVGIGAWSVASGADLSTTGLRLLISAIVLQLGYFLVIVVLAMTSSSEAREPTIKVASKKPAQDCSPQKAKRDPN